MLVKWRNSAAIRKGIRGVYTHSVIRAEESGAMWLDVAQLLSNHFPFLKVQSMINTRYITEISAEQL